MSKRGRAIPGRAEWAGYEGGLDVKYAHKLLFGKSSAFRSISAGGCSIERADELLFMPRGAFQYYVFAFSDFVRSQEAAGDADSASSFLRLLLNRETRDGDGVAEIYSELLPVVQYVASHQEAYDADPDINIYGDFADLASQLDGLCQERS
jgi:hypothetical protein